MSFARASMSVGLASLLVAACGDSPSTEPSTVHQRPEKGYTVTVPDGWHRAHHNLTPQITDPVEMVSLATTPFEAGDGICDALARIVPDAALVTIQERAVGAESAQFADRPAHFRPRRIDEGHSTWPLCGVEDGKRPIPMDHYWFGFRDAGRAFHVLVAFGKEAPEDLREEAFAVLDSLRIDPDVTLDWSPPEASAYRDQERAFGVTIPAGWRRARGPVDDVTTNPRELVVLSTFELPVGAEGTRLRLGGNPENDGCGPFYDHVLDYMPDEGAMLAVRERLGDDVAGPPEFDPRPQAFELEPIEPEPGGCQSDERRHFQRWWISFEDAGRDFYAQVAIGLDAPNSLRRDAEAALNSFRPTAD